MGKHIRIACPSRQSSVRAINTVNVEVASRGLSEREPVVGRKESFEKGGRIMGGTCQMKCLVTSWQESA